MKKGKITLGIVLGLLIIGFVVAQAQGVFDDDGSASAVEPFSLSAGGVFCLDRIESCNDVKFAYQSVGGGLFSLNGYEYGCNFEEVLCDGTMRVEGNTLYIDYIAICSYAYTTPRIGQYNVQIDLRTLSGPVQYAYHYDGYHTREGTARLIVCPLSEVVSNEPADGE